MAGMFDDLIPQQTVVKPKGMFDDLIPAKPKGPRYYSADDPPPVERKGKKSPYPTPDMPGAKTFTATGTTEMDNKSRQKELDAMGGPTPPNMFSDLIPAKKAGAESGNEFTRAFVRSVGPQNLTLTGHTLKAYEDLTGDMTFSKSADDLILDGENWDKGIPPAKVPTLKDIDLLSEGGLGRLGDWLAQSAGSGAGSTVIPMAGGFTGGFLGGRLAGKPGAAAGSILGAFTGSNALNIGSMRKTLIEEGVTDPKLRGKVAIAGGMAMSGLDSLLPGEIASKFTGAARKELERSIIRRLLGGAARGSLKEGLTEGAQAAIEETFGKTAAGKNIDAWQLIDEVVENAAQGAVGGAVMGGPADALAGPGTPPVPAVTPPVTPQTVNAAGKGDRVEPNMFADLIPKPAAPTEATGITPEDVQSMTPAQRAVIEKDLAEQGAPPVPEPIAPTNGAQPIVGDTRETKPEPGKAPMAPRNFAPPKENMFSDLVPQRSEIAATQEAGPIQPISEPEKPSMPEPEPIVPTEENKQAPALPQENTVTAETMDQYRRMSSVIDEKVFTDIVSDSVQRDGQKLLDAARKNDIATIQAIRAKYDRDAGLAQGGGGSGPGKVKTPRRGAIAIHGTADKWLQLFGPKTEVPREAVPEKVAPPKPPVRAPIMRRDMEDDSAVTSSGRDVPVKYAVVEASDLVASQLDDGGANPQYPAELQPRDRERAVSQQQVQDIATRLDPRLLDKSPKASDGAPIIAADGTVESGNGRVLAIRRAYRQGGDAAKRYRDHLAAQGYPVSDVREPVLVRVRQGELDPESRQAFTREANERDTLGMSATERAMADATALPDNVLEMYRGGDVEAAGNREFVRAFIRDVVGKNDQANLIASDGTLSQEAIRRVEAALLGKAYGDADLVASLVESTDSNIKAIGGALMDVAPAWAQMRAEAKAGTIDKDADQTERLLEAVRLVQRARREDQPLALLVGQNDIFSGTSIHPIAEAFLRLMFRDMRNWKQPMGRDRMAGALQFYVDEERKTSSGVDLLGETAAKPADILSLAKRKQDNGEAAGTADQPKLDLAKRPSPGPGESAGASGVERTAQDIPAGQASRSEKADGDGKGKAGLEEGENELSPPSNYTALDSFIPNDKQNLGSRAKEYVMRHGKRLDVEVLLTFDGDGNIVSDGHGTRRSVGLSPLHARMQEDPTSNLVIHHNHPSSSSFSRLDIAMLSKPGTKVVWAHAADGTSFRVTLNPELREAADSSYLFNFLDFMQREPMGGLFDVLQGRVLDEKISVDTAHRQLTHFRNVALHKAGITDYFASKPFALDAEIMQAVEQAVAAIRKVLSDENITIGRSAKPVRYIGDMGVLAEGNRYAGEGRPDSAVDQGSGRNDRGEKGQRLDEDGPELTPIVAKTMVELKAKIYKAQGWTRTAGESQAQRINQFYDVTFDQRNNRIIATPKSRPRIAEEDEAEFTAPPGPPNPNRDPEAGLFTTEPGAEGLPQMVIPGAERVSVATQTQRLADAKLKPKVAQKSLEIGLFGDDSKQYTLLEDESEFAAANFYSGLIRAVEGLKQPKAPASQWMGMIRNAQGVKPEEIAWVGLEEWLSQQSGSITKEALLGFLNANQVQVSEVVKGVPADGVKSFDTQEQALDYIAEQTGTTVEEVKEAYGYYLPDDYINLAYSMASKNSPDTAKFASYQLPGGENYRELLLTLPTEEIQYTKENVYIDDEATAMRSEGDNALFWFVRAPDNVYQIPKSKYWTPQGAVDYVIREKKPSTDPTAFRSSHFDELNIVAHVRFNERTDGEGARTLFVEEIQSDLHQKGRKYGYGDAKSYSIEYKNADGFWVLDDTFDDLTRAEIAVAQFKSSGLGEARIVENTRLGSVPDAPFKTSWPELALKRMVRWAAEKGFDKLAWTPGSVQAERYDLSKQISSLSWHEENKRLQMKPINRDWREGQEIGSVTRENLSDYVGKDVAEKLVAMQPDRVGFRVLDGLDLKVGGEGMSAFYDGILVSVANKLGKKFGAKVGQGEIKFEKRGGPPPMLRGPTWTQEYETYPIHSLPITDSMRDSVMQGQALFEDENGFTQPRRRQSGTRGMPASRPGPSSFIETDDSTMSVLMNQNLPMLGRIGGAISNATLPIRRGVQDKMADWKRTEKAMIEQTGVLPQSMQVYRTETLFHGRTGERLEDLRMDTIEPLIQKMADLKVTQADLDKYLYARHAPERNEYIATINPDLPDGGSGMTNAEAAAVIRDMQRRGVLANVRTIAAKIDIMLRDNRERLFNNGIIDQETFDSWSNDYAHYVPLRGFEVDPEADARLGQGKRYDSRTKVTLEALGRRSKADSPLAYIIAQAQQSIILAEKARVGRSVLRLARQYPNPNLWEVDQVVSKRVLDPTTGLVSTRIDNTARVRAENVLAVREGGKLYWVTLHHAGLLAGIKGTEASAMNAVVRAGVTINRYLALMRTGLDPQFFIPNFLRDLETAGIHIAADQGKTILKNVLRDLPKALKGSFQGERGNLTSAWAQHYREFAQAGGKVGVFGLEDIGTIKNRIARDLAWAEGGTAVSALKAAAAVKDFVMDINGAIESGVRLSLFVNMRRAGYSVDDAAFAAKEATVNFNRKGEWGNWLNATYMFFNASVQGTARIAQALARSKLVRRAAFGMFAAGIVMDIVNSMIAGDSDDDGENDYDQIQEHIKERNLIFMWPGSESGQETHVPLPWVYNVFVYAGVNVGRIVRGKIKPTEGAANIMGAIAQAANPLYSNSWVQMLTPTVLDPGLDLYMNEDWKGDKIMPADSPYGLPTPDSQKAWETVNPAWKWTAETLNNLTGGDAVRPGTIDVSPESIEYIWDFLLGGVGSTINQVSTTAGTVIRGDELNPERIPFVRKVYGKHVSATGRDEYYQMRDAVLLTEAQIEEAKDAKDRAKMIAVRKEFPADVRALPLLKETDKLLTKLRKQKNAATSEEAKQKINERMDLIRSRFRKKYRQLQEKLQ